MAFYRTDDPLDDFARYDAEREREREEIRSMLPRCADCDNPIEDEEAYYINGEWICEACMESYKREVWPE